MAELFLDGFDHYASTDTLTNYTSGNAFTSMQTGLLGTGKCARVNGIGPKLSLSATVATFVMGFRFRTDTINTSTSSIMSFFDASGNVIATLAILNTGAIAWFRGNNSTQVAASAAGLITVNAINFVEVKVTLATGTTGTVDIHVNGASVASASTIATANTTAAMQSFQYPSTVSGNADYDDLYVFDTTGTACNDFAGDCKILTVAATGAGRIAQFTANGAASNYLCVNQTTPDADTTYVSSATAGQIDAYATGGIGSATAVKGVQVSVMARKDDANTRTLAIGVGNGTTENFDAGTNLGSTYVFLRRQLSTNPITGVAWTTSDFATLQAAIKCIA